jgi:hypothetical protein
MLSSGRHSSLLDDGHGGTAASAFRRCVEEHTHEMPTLPDGQGDASGKGERPAADLRRDRAGLEPSYCN